MNNNNLFFELKKKTILENSFLNELHYEYENQYLKENYKLNDFFLNINHNQIYIPYTEKKGEITNYSFFSLPCKIYSSKPINFIETKKTINEFLKDKPLADVDYKFTISISQNELKKINLKSVNPLLVEELQIINLELEEKEIFKRIKSNHKNEIKKILNLENIEILIYDYKNYQRNLIMEMMSMHKKVVGRLTRSMETWKLNEKMIIQKKGFLVKVLMNKKPISYSFFNHNYFECNYFSSVSDKESFKLRGINHLSIWEAIKFAKKIGNKKFRLGTTKYLYTRSKEQIETKMKNIAFFKSRFCGEIEINITLDRLTKIK